MPSSKLHRWAIPLLLAVSGWVVLGITLIEPISKFRTFAVFTFALIGPGTALIRLLSFRDFLERAILAIALSISLAVLTVEFDAIGHPLQTSLVLAVLASICTGASVAELVRGAKAQC